jgi:hypothetical protein
VTRRAATGVIAKTWGAEKDAANLYLFDRRGRLIRHEALRDFDATRFDSIVEAARGAAGR